MVSIPFLWAFASGKALLLKQVSPVLFPGKGDSLSIFLAGSFPRRTICFDGGSVLGYLGFRSGGLVDFRLMASCNGWDLDINRLILSDDLIKWWWWMKGERGISICLSGGFVYGDVLDFPFEQSISGKEAKVMRRYNWVSVWFRRGRV